ncbi:MAG: hypothetical protein ABSB50_17385 [Terracidiphilus sp.]
MATIAAALEPRLFSSLEMRGSISTLMDVVDHPSTYGEAPEMTCLDLLRDFDFDTLRVIASPVKEDFSAVAPEKIFWN